MNLRGEKASAWCWRAVLGGVCVVCGVLSACDLAALPLPAVGTWARHTISSAWRGADGARLGDVDGDGDMDVVAGWEESGVVTVHLNPGAARATGGWPSVVVGAVADVEDAVLVDVDGDGALDVVSCAEGDTRQVNVHWGPDDASDVTDGDAWRTASFSAVHGMARWMFCAPGDVDGDGRIDLVVGAKGDDAPLGYLRAPATPRNVDAWTFVPLTTVRWTMSVVVHDVDADGDEDVVYTDRKGGARGCWWLENLGTASWSRHLIGTSDDELMFLDLADLDGNGWREVLVATDAREVLHFVPGADVTLPWLVRRLSWSDAFGTGKGVRAGDLDGDGVAEVVFSCENADGRAGLGRLAATTVGAVATWAARPLGGEAGDKFDLVQLVDVDADGDLDVVTTEESAGLGVVWYENPGPVAEGTQ